MASTDELVAEHKRLTIHRSHLRARRVTAWFYKRKPLEAKVYQRLAKLQTRIEALERQMTNRGVNEPTKKGPKS